MGDSCDFIERLGKDLSLSIFMCLENPSDLARACSVSTGWRRFVIENTLCKQLCLKMHPELSNVLGVVELNEVRVSNRLSLPGSLERDHRVFVTLASGLKLFPAEDCISAAICASSTDSFPLERVENTLEANDDILRHRPSYWSSKGESDPDIPETLIYRLIASLCLISEIHIQPFQAYFEFGFPIYSAKAVRFRLGHLKPSLVIEGTCKAATGHNFADDMFIWTYTSPEYPMIQAAVAQKFQLPRPVLCMGGILEIELLGRAQREELDGLYYICVSRVQAIGRPLGPAFEIDILGHTGKCILKYYPEAVSSMTIQNREAASSPSKPLTSTQRVRTWDIRPNLNLLLDEYDDDHDDDLENSDTDGGDDNY